MAINKQNCEHKWEVDGNFRYCDPCHTYELDGKPLSGVTTIIKEAFPPPLHWWGSGMALEPLGWTNPKQVSKEEGIEIARQVIHSEQFAKVTSDEINWYYFLQDCYRNHDEFKKTRGKEGTQTHKFVENYILTCIRDTGGKPIKAESENIQDFIDWAVENVDRFIASEKKTYSVEHFYAGTMDFLFTKGDKVYVGDIKTSKQIYPENFVQCGAYQICLEETEGIETAGSVIVKLNGKIETKWSYNTDRDRKIFLFALESVRLKRTYN